LTTRYMGMGKRNHKHVNIQMKVRMIALIVKNKHKRISLLCSKYGISRIKFSTLQQWTCVTIM